MISFLFLWLLNTNLSLGAGNSWQKTFGGSGNDAIFQMLERPDGSFLGVGKTESLNGDLARRPKGRGQDAWILRTDAKGRRLHSAAEGGSGFDLYAAAANTADGGYIVVGSSGSLDHSATDRPRRSADTDVWVRKFDQNHRLQWQKFLGGSEDDLGVSVAVTTDGYLIGADSYSADGDVATNNGGHGHHGCVGNRDFWLVKLSLEGQIRWTRSYGGTNQEYLSQVVVTADGGIALAGRTESFDGDVRSFMGEYDGWVLKTDGEGRLQWETTVGGAMWDWGSNIVATPDGGVLFSGYTFSWDKDGAGNKGDYDYFLVKLSANGERQWNRLYGGAVDDFAQGLVRLADGSFVVTGGSVSHDQDVPENRGSFDLWAIRVNSTGDLLWSRTYGGSAYDISSPGGSDYYMAGPGHALGTTADGGVIVAGTTRSHDGDLPGNHGRYDAWALKIPKLTGPKLGKRGSTRPLRPKRSPRIASPEKAPGIEWSQAYGGRGNDLPLDAPQALAHNGHGGYIFVATTESTDSLLPSPRGGTDVFVTNVDARGRRLWQKRFGGEKNDQAAAIARGATGGFAFVATIEAGKGDVREARGMSDIWVVRLDESGEIAWQRTLGGSSADVATAIAPTRDGGFLVGGSTYSRDGDVKDGICGFDYWIVKLNEKGEIQWTRSAGGLSNDNLIQVIETLDGGVAAVGRTESRTLDGSGNHGMYDFLLVRLDGKGNKLWARTYGGADWEWGNTIVALRDGGFALAGFSYTFDDFESGQIKCNHGEQDYWVARTDAEGKLLWQQCFGGSNYELGFGLTETRDGGLALVGGTASSDGQISGYKGKWDTWLVKMNSKGRLLWEKTLGGSDYEVGYSVIEAADGGLVVLSESFSRDGDVKGNNGGEDAWLVKLKAEKASRSRSR